MFVGYYTSTSKILFIIYRSRFTYRYRSFIFLRNLLNFSKCSLSLAFNDNSTELLYLLLTNPSAYKNPNQ